MRSRPTVDGLASTVCLLAALGLVVVGRDALRLEDMLAAGFLLAAGVVSALPWTPNRLVAAALVMSAVTTSIPAVVRQGPAAFRVIPLGLSAVVGLRALLTHRSVIATRTRPVGPVSFVVLLRHGDGLEQPVVAKTVARAWDARIATDDDRTETRIVGHRDRFLVEHRGYTLVVQHTVGSFFDDPVLVARYTRDRRLRRAVEEHRASVLATVLYAPHDCEPADGFPLVGRLTAELLDDDTLAVVCPSLRALYPTGRTTADALRSLDPISALDALRSSRPFVVAEDDPRLQRAELEARDRWAEFESAFESRNDDDEFSVKAPFGDGRHTECVWIHVTAIENRVVYGTLGNEPMRLEHIRFDDRLRVHVEQVNDWMFSRGDIVHGGFTLDVFRELADEEESREP